MQNLEINPTKFSKSQGHVRKENKFRMPLYNMQTAVSKESQIEGFLALNHDE